MKRKITLTLLVVALHFLAFGQQKATGLIDLASNMKAQLVLDSGTSTVVLTLSGPNDRWFALQFGSFTGGMQAGSDLVYWNNVTLVDAKHNGVGVTPSVDASNDWTLISNTNNTPSTGLRTLVYSRPFNTGDSNDFVFNFNDTTVDFAWARSNSTSFTLAYHEVANRGVFLNTAFSTLNAQDFSLNQVKIYPNPSNGVITFELPVVIEALAIYSLTGKLVKEYENLAAQTVTINTDNLETGVYFVELRNEGESMWKKVIID
ncbi:T9SS type A sorting domain-containing protein [Flavobacterium chuncheonense]|uniref:T9SS type A sorting domain-containing protein n=1 Tax=Flavobacterium chuncheonense TaxID=2026653 RepID=A0ABW5YR38_9FLAO